MINLCKSSLYSFLLGCAFYINTLGLNGITNILRIFSKVVHFKQM